MRAPTGRPSSAARFAAHFGPIANRHKPKAGSSGTDSPEWTNLMPITDKKDETGKAIGALGHGEMWFHTDKCYHQAPHRASFLYGIEIPTEGGHTKFSSSYAAYEKLPDSVKQRIDGRMVMQGHQYTTGRRIDLTVDIATMHH